MYRSLVISLVLAAPFLTPTLAAQRGDNKNHVMTEVWREMDVPAAPALSPEKALKTFKVAPGFRIELVAGDDMLDNPVSMTWDGDGRLWVVQMCAFMPNVDGKGENAKTGRVSVLEDRDGDGRMDQASIFLDGLVMPRAVAMVQGGVLIAEPPNLWFCRDTDGDLRCDQKTSVTKYARQGPVEHTDNGLLFAMDNWIYSAKSNRRFQWKGGKLVETKTRFRGQWGINQDNFGRLYYTSNSNYLISDWDTHNQPIRMHLGDRSIHSIRVNPGINRGYQSAMLRKDGRLARVTAISGPAIYRGALYGESFTNGAFVPEPSANAVAYFEYSERQLSPSFRHKIYDDPKWGKREFLTSTDERFRPVSLYSGPDGCIYLVDLYHGILQHKVYVTTFLRKQILERGLDTDNHRGRIYRLVPIGKKLASQRPRLIGAKPKDLTKYLEHPNGWWRDTAQRLLVQAGDKSVAPALTRIVESSANTSARMHALWTLRGIDAIDPALFQKAASDPDDKVRLAANAALVGSANALAEKIVSNFGKLDNPGKTAYRRGQRVYNMLCFACHQPHGRGFARLAPPLAGSDWVNGSATRLARVTLSGLTGPIVVSGKHYKDLPVMPGHAPAFDDKQIADVLTYIRNTWGNTAPPVSPATIKSIRKASAGHPQPWTAEELKDLE